MNTPGFQKSLMRPRISVSGARAAYVGPGLDLEPHRNVATTVAIALQSPFLLSFLDGSEPTGDFASKSIALIPSGSMHHLRASGDMAFIYLDSLSDDYAGLQTCDLEKAHTRLTTCQVDAVRSWNVDEFCSVLGIALRPPADPRIGNLVRRIDERPQDFGNIQDVAALAGLSSSRFQSLFRQAVGVPYRRYRLWRRMAVVMQAVFRGDSLTNAALDAGFSSSAHLSSTFKTMFGLSPSSLVALDVLLESLPSCSSISRPLPLQTPVRLGLDWRASVRRGGGCCHSVEDLRRPASSAGASRLIATCQRGCTGVGL